MVADRSNCTLTQQKLVTFDVDVEHTRHDTSLHTGSASYDELPTSKWYGPPPNATLHVFRDEGILTVRTTNITYVHLHF